MMSQWVLTAVEETPCEEDAAAAWIFAGLPPEAATKIPAPRLSATTAPTGPRYGRAIVPAAMLRPRRRTGG